MEGIIIYNSRYGATEQYGRWLATRLHLPLHSVADVSAAKLAGCELVIVGSSVYVGELLMKKWLNENSDLLTGKKIFLFIVCGTTADDQKLQEQVLNGNLSPELRRSVDVFFLPGRCLTSTLSWKDRLLLKMGAWLEKDPKKKAIMKKGFDQMDQKNLDEVVTAVTAEQKKLKNK